MSWHGGTDIMSGLIRLAQCCVPEEKRVQFYSGAIALLEDADWCDPMECARDCPDRQYVEAVFTVHPKWRQHYNADGTPREPE